MENSYIWSATSNLTDPVDKAIKKLELHPSILEIRKRVTGPSFSFDTLTSPDIELEIRKLNPNKATACDIILAKSLIENVDICAPVLHPIINNALQDYLFPDKLKLADLGPLPKSRGEVPVSRHFLLPLPRPLFQWKGWGNMMFFFKVKVLTIHHHHFGKCHQPRTSTTPSNLRGDMKNPPKFKFLELTWNFACTKNRECRFQKYINFHPSLIPV